MKESAAQDFFFGKTIELIKGSDRALDGRSHRVLLAREASEPAGQNNCTNFSFRDLCLSTVVKSQKQARKASECGTLKIHSSKSFNLINEM